MEPEELQKRKKAALDALKQICKVYNAALVLVDAVEKYVRQECSRSTLLSMKDNLKKLLENDKIRWNMLPKTMRLKKNIVYLQKQNLEIYEWN